VAVPAQTTKGWVYNYQTGEIVVNTNTTDAAGDQYDTKY
jgi:hypothetical protein